MFFGFFGKNVIILRQNTPKEDFLQKIFEKALVETEKKGYSLYTNDI